MTLKVDFRKPKYAFPQDLGYAQPFFLLNFFLLLSRSLLSEVLSLVSLDLAKGFSPF
jgi:hypothetical protein